VPGKPASATVGRFGASAERLLEVTASPTIVPSARRGAQVVTEHSMKSTWSPIRSVSAALSPLYGMWTALVFVRCLSSSPPRCMGEPAPAEPKFSLPGRLRIASTRPCMSFTCSSGFATTMKLSCPTLPTKSKSPSGSKGSFGLRVALIACASVPNSSV
jgi:hypothetical protein